MPEEGRSGTTTGAAAGAAAGSGGTAAGTEDWAAETADRLDQLIATIRSQTTDRLVSVARLVVFGLLATAMAGMAAVLLVIAAFRALNQLIPEEVWLTYLVVGAIFTGLGLFLWSKKERPPSTA